jgi:hypothetical protein
LDKDQLLMLEESVEDTSYQDEHVADEAEYVKELDNNVVQQMLFLPLLLLSSLVEMKG